MTLQDLLTYSMVEATIIDAGNTASTAEYDAGLLLANFILDGWNGEPNAQPTHDQVSVALTGSASYTITPRPLRITGARAANSGGIVKPVKVVTDSAEFGSLADQQTLTEHWPKAVFCDYGSPTCTLYVAPASTGTLYLSTIRPMFTLFSALSDVVSMAVPGYLRLLQLELAVGLCSQFGRQVPPAVQAAHADAKASIGQRNMATRSGAPLSAPAAPAA